MIDTGAWQDYLDGFASMAGTLFALVVAARGLVIGIGTLTRQPGERHRGYLLFDSVASTYELAAAALLALFARMPAKSYWFLGVLPLFVATLGVGLVVGGWISVLLAWDDLKSSESRTEGLMQAVLSILPTLCYLACFRIWLAGTFGIWRWPRGWMPPADALGLAVSWLTVSGTLQAIWWYRKTWDAQLSRKRDVSAGAEDAANVMN